MLSTLLFFTVACLLFAMIPGPDFAQLFRSFLIAGKKAALASAFGVGCGLCLHTVLSVVGLTAIIVHSPVLFKGVQYAGAVYLGIIGTVMLGQSLKRGGKKEPNFEEGSGCGKSKQERPLTYFRQSFLVNVLNPKAFIFFLTMLPQFVRLESSVPAQTQVLVLGVCVCLVTMGWFCFLSCLLEKFAKIFEKNAVRVWLERATACIFICLALRLAIAG